MQVRKNSGKAVTHPRRRARRERALELHRNQLEQYEAAVGGDFMSYRAAKFNADVLRKNIKILEKKLGR